MVSCRLDGIPGSSMVRLQVLSFVSPHSGWNSFNIISWCIPYVCWRQDIIITRKRTSWTVIREDSVTSLTYHHWCSQSSTLASFTSLCFPQEILAYSSTVWDWFLTLYCFMIFTYYVVKVRVKNISVLLCSEGIRWWFSLWWESLNHSVSYCGKV